MTEAIFWGSEWPDPDPLPDSIPDVPEFDTALLPDTLQPWIADIAERMQCPPDFPAVACMVALSSVVGRQIVRSQSVLKMLHSRRLWLSSYGLIRISFQQWL